MKPEGHAAIVTGGGSGLGAASAEALIRAGAKVALLDVNLEAAQRVAAKLGALAIACDVTDADSAAKAIDAAKAKHGPARILVNCAGIAPAKRIVGREGPMPLEDFARVVGVNLVGSFNMMRLAASAMSALDPLEDNERGVIISTASIAAYEGQVGQAAYAASKGGVVSLTLPAAREFAQLGIRVNAIAPGIFATPMLRGLPEEVQQSLAASVPFPKTLGDPAQYAALALHIVENRYINGETIRLDGALRMPPK